MDARDRQTDATFAAENPQAAPGPMDATELRECLEAMWLSQRGLATIVKADSREVRRWAAGQAPVPSAVAAWLRTMRAWHDANPPPLDWEFEDVTALEQQP